MWLLAAVVRRGPAADALGPTPAARLAALDRALPRGTSLDSARAFLHARRLAFAQAPPPAGGGGSALVVVLPAGLAPGGALPAASVTLEFDAGRRLAGRRVAER